MPSLPGDREYNQKFAMFTGSVLYGLMAWTYETMWRGQHKELGLMAVTKKLEGMWYNPAKHRVYVNKPLAALMQTDGWKKRSRGFLDYAKSYLFNYYLREFGDYPVAAANVQQNMVGLATDRKSLITLEFASPSTGKLYKIFMRIARVMKAETSEGLVLTGYAYRTGKELAGDGEEFLARTIGMGLLRAYGRKGEDGKWHFGAPDGPVIAKLQSQLEYRNSHRTWRFDTADFMSLGENEIERGPIFNQITSAIERMEADEAYQEYYRINDKPATEEDLKKKGRGASKIKAEGRIYAKGDRKSKKKMKKGLKTGKVKELAVALLDEGKVKFGADGNWHVATARGKVITSVDVYYNTATGKRVATFHPKDILKILQAGVEDGSVTGTLANQVKKATEKASKK